jgi:hypothetical protein
MPEPTYDSIFDIEIIAMDHVCGHRAFAGAVVFVILAKECSCNSSYLSMATSYEVISVFKSSSTLAIQSDQHFLLSS